MLLTHSVDRLAANDDPPFCEVDFLPDLPLVPFTRSFANQRRSNELGPNIGLSEVLFIYFIELLQWIQTPPSDPKLFNLKFRHVVTKALIAEFEMTGYATRYGLRQIGISNQNSSV